MTDSIISLGSGIICMIVSIAGISKEKKKLRLFTMFIAFVFIAVGSYFLYEEIQKNNEDPSSILPPVQLTVNFDGQSFTFDSAQDMNSNKEDAVTTAEEDASETIIANPRIIVTAIISSGYEYVMPIKYNNFMKLNRSDKIHVYADLSDNNLAVQFSTDEKIMANNNLKTNKNGVAYTGYYIVPYTAEGKVAPEFNNDQKEIIKLDAPTSGEISLSDFEPGYYAICVSSIGTINKYNKDGMLYKSNTGWLPYYIHVE